MRTTLLLALLLLPTSATAEETLGAPSFDNLTECTWRQVTWDHFRGNPIKPQGVNRWRKATFAHIATMIRLGHFEVALRQEGEDWVATPVDPRPFAVMNKDFSAVEHGSRNDYSLAHEQLHFDIAEATARRLAVELAALEGRGASEEEAGEKLAKKFKSRFEEGLKKLQALQQRYDGETDHGEKKRAQKKWARQVSEMFSEATEALKKQQQSGI